MDIMLRKREILTNERKYRAPTLNSFKNTNSNNNLQTIVITCTDILQLVNYQVIYIHSKTKCLLMT